jgi:hypothetical protein
VGTVLVVIVAVGVGVLVFRLTAGGEEPIREAEETRAPGGIGAWAGGAPTPPAEQPSERAPEVPAGYIPVASGAPSWHARLGGAMGLVIAVAVGAIALALSLWGIAALVGRLVSDAGA